MIDSYSILFAEDDVNVRKNYKIYLENYFGKIYEANDGYEALNIYKNYKPDVLLLDITMDKLSGLDLIKKVRKYDNDTPIIILSAHSDKEYLFQAVKLNLVDYLVKPISRNDFRSIIESTIYNLDSIKSDNKNNRIIISKDTYWDKKIRMFFYKNKVLDLTKNERMLFELFLNRKNQIVKPIDISSYVWSEVEHDNLNDGSIRNLVKRLRKKLPVDIIKSIYGSGYILNF
ncbi:MAG: response regulator [Arcobacter sp.]|nr:response regulator [Arcobacter sp.]